MARSALRSRQSSSSARSTPRFERDSQQREHISSTESCNKPLPAWLQPLQILLTRKSWARIRKSSLKWQVFKFRRAREQWFASCLELAVTILCRWRSSPPFSLTTWLTASRKDVIGVLKYFDTEAWGTL